MTIRLTKPEIDWIKQEYEADRTVAEIAIDTGYSKSNIKRALAEAGIMSLDWYKTNNEISMLNYLASKGIHTIDDLRGKL